MLIGSDIIETIATLNNAGYLRGAREMVQATESIGKSSSHWDKLARASLISGGLLAGGAADALKWAAKYQQIQQSMEAMYGKAPGDALFDKVKKMSFDTPFTTEQLSGNVKMAAAYGFKLQDVLRVTKDIGDATVSAFGDNAPKMASAMKAIGEMNEMQVQRRQMNMLTTDAGLPMGKYFKDALHLSDAQLGDIGKMHIPGEVGVAITLRGIEKDNARHDRMKTSMNSLGGQESDVKDAVQQLLAASGSPALAPAIAGMRMLANAIRYLTSATSSKALGGALFIGAPALVIGGAAIKGWQQYTLAKNLAKIAQQGETKAEQDKLPVLEKEGAKLAEGTGKWGKFGVGIKGAGEWLAKYAAKSGVADIATASLGRQALVGAARLGLIGVAVAGVIYDISLLVRAYKELGDASTAWEASNAAEKRAKALGYDEKHSSMQGSDFAKLSRSKQLGELTANSFASWATFGLWKPYNTDISNMGTSAYIDKKWIADHKGKHGPKNGILAQQRAAAAKAAAANPPDAYQKIIDDYLKNGSEGAAGGTGKKVKGWQLPKRYSEMVAADQAHVAALKAQHATMQAINNAKNVEIAHMKTIAQLYLQQSKLAKDPNEKYRLKTLSDNEMTKASNLKASETKKRKSFDDIITTIISWQDSVQEPDAIKMGVNRRLFSSMSKGHPLSLSAGKAQGHMLGGLVSSRPLHVHVHIGDKEISTISKKVSDTLIDDIVKMLGGSHNGSPLSVK